MRKLVLALVIIGFCSVALADERTVILPRDNRPFTVTQGDIVRLIGMGIAGSKIEAKVEGSAKIETTSNIKELSNGKPLIGNQVKVFDLKPTGPGKVTATITVTPPQPDARFRHRHRGNARRSRRSRGPSAGAAENRRSRSAAEGGRAGRNLRAGR